MVLDVAPPLQIALGFLECAEILRVLVKVLAQARGVHRLLLEVAKTRGAHGLLGHGLLDVRDPVPQPLDGIQVERKQLDALRAAGGAEQLLGIAGIIKILEDVVRRLVAML